MTESSEDHDLQWGFPNFDDRDLFECLSLKGAQARPNRYTILKKRVGHRQAFENYKHEILALYDDVGLRTFSLN